MKKRDQKKKNKYKPLKRKIHLSKDEIWSWEIRGGHVVMIRSPDHRTTYKTTVWHLLDLEDIEIDPIDCERGFHTRIGPKDIIEEIAKIKDGSTACST